MQRHTNHRFTQLKSLTQPGVKMYMDLAMLFDHGDSFSTPWLNTMGRQQPLCPATGQGSYEDIQTQRARTNAARTAALRHGARLLKTTPLAPRSVPMEGRIHSLTSTAIPDHRAADLGASLSSIDLLARLIQQQTGHEIAPDNFGQVAMPIPRAMKG